MGQINRYLNDIVEFLEVVVRKLRVYPVRGGHKYILQSEFYTNKEQSQNGPCSGADVVKMLEYLIDNIFVELGGQIFQQQQQKKWHSYGTLAQ